MKKLMFAVAILACAACSSAKKKETTSSDVPAATTQTTTSTETTVREEKATPTKSSSDVTFGEISGTEKSSVTCSNKGDSRKITVLNVTEGGCGVVYNKAGEDKTVAQAKSSMDYCDNVAGKIKSNLEGAGFDCGGGSAAPAAEAQ